MKRHALRTPRLPWLAPRLWLAPLLWVLVAAAGPGSVAGVRSLLLDSEPGEPLGNGEFQFFTTDDGRFFDRFEASTTDHVKLGFSGPGNRPNWHLEFAAPPGEPLAVQVYEDAVPVYRQDTGQPGLVVHGNQRVCPDTFGRFEVKQVGFDDAGVIAIFWATFEQTCGGAVLRGEIRYNADPPIILEAPSHLAIGEGRTLAFEVRGRDAQGDPVALSATGLPPGASFSDAGDGTGHLSLTTEVGQIGSHWVAFQGLSDGGDVDVVYTRIEVIVDFDDFDHAIPIPSLPFESTFEHVPATRAADDPVCPGPAGGPRPDPEGTVWYAFTPLEDTRVHAVTYAPCSPGSPVLSVYTGERGALEQITCNSREAWFSARAGRTYNLMIGLAPGSTFGLSVQVAPPPPANDDLDQATVVGALPFNDTLDTRGATVTPADDNVPCARFGTCFAPRSRGTVWYTYTPAEDTRVTVDAAGSDFAPLLAAFSGARGALVFLGCGGSGLSFTAYAGQNYYLMIASTFPFGSTAAQLVLSITGMPALTIEVAFEPAGGLDPQSGAAIIHATATCSRPADIVVKGTLQQHRVAGVFEVGGPCVGTTRWRVEVLPSTTGPVRARFVAGRARVAFNATAVPDDKPDETALASGLAGVVLKARSPRR